MKARPSASDRPFRPLGGLARLLAVLTVTLLGAVLGIAAAWAADVPAPTPVPVPPPAQAPAQAPALLVTNLPPAPPALPDVTFPLFRIFGALVLVLALFVGGAWLVRHGSGFTGPRNGPPARLRMLEMRSLGARHALFVVAYDQQRLLIASSPAGITLLDRLPPASEAEAAMAPDAPVNFAEALRRLLPRR